MSKIIANLAGEPSSQSVSMNTIARIGGFAYLGVIIFALFSEAYVRGSIVDSSNLAKTSADIIAKNGLWRMGMVADVLTIACDLLVTATLYILLRPKFYSLSIVAAVTRISAASVLAMASLFSFAPLMIFSDVSRFFGFSQDQLQQLSMFLIRLHNETYHISLILFGINGVLLGYGLLKSRLIPNIFSIGIGLMGVAYFSNSVLHFIAPNIQAYTGTFTGLFCLVAELAFSLWLIFKGVKE